MVVLCFPLVRPIEDEGQSRDHCKIGREEAPIHLFTQDHGCPDREHEKPNQCSQCPQPRERTTKPPSRVALAISARIQRVCVTASDTESDTEAVVRGRRNAASKPHRPAAPATALGRYSLAARRQLVGEGDGAGAGGGVDDGEYDEEMLRGLHQR